MKYCLSDHNSTLLHQSTNHNSTIFYNRLLANPFFTLLKMVRPQMSPPAAIARVLSYDDDEKAEANTASIVVNPTSESSTMPEQSKDVPVLASTLPTDDTAVADTNTESNQEKPQNDNQAEAEDADAEMQDVNDAPVVHVVPNVSRIAGVGGKGLYSKHPRKSVGGKAPRSLVIDVPAEEIQAIESEPIESSYVSPARDNSDTSTPVRRANPNTNTEHKDDNDNEMEDDENAEEQDEDDNAEEQDDDDNQDEQDDDNSEEEQNEDEIEEDEDVQPSNVSSQSNHSSSRKNDKQEHRVVSISDYLPSRSGNAKWKIHFADKSYRYAGMNELQKCKLLLGDFTEIWTRFHKPGQKEQWNNISRKLSTHDGFYSFYDKHFRKANGVSRETKLCSFRQIKSKKKTTKLLKINCQAKALRHVPLCKPINRRSSSVRIHIQI